MKERTQNAIQLSHIDLQNLNVIQNVRRENNNNNKNNIYCSVKIITHFFMIRIIIRDSGCIIIENIIRILIKKWSTYSIIFLFLLLMLCTFLFRKSIIHL